LASDPHFTYGDLLLRSLHFMMVGYDLSKSPGLWRPGDIYVRPGSVSRFESNESGASSLNA
jgi:hypothetical protein